MLKTLVKVNTSNQLPDSTSVVIIGGGIVGICAALTLAERGVPVVVLEKGHIAAEQSSRNLGWIRKTSRHAEDVPLAQAADKIWSNLSERVDAPVGYRQAGIMFLGDTDEQMAIHEKWLDSVAGLDLDSTLLSKAELDKLVPGGNGSWKGAVYTPSDGRGEPTLATSAIANAAIKYGATIVQQCAVRTLSMQAGKVSGVITELGEIRCDQVLLAGGAWSRRFLGNLGVQLPTLPVIASVLRTKPIKGPTEIAVGGSDFSFRKHQDGGFIIMQRGKVDAPLTLDHLKIGLQFKDQLRFGKDALNISFGKEFFEDLSTPRSWTANKRSPFESIRVREPRINHGLLDDAMRNTINAWPIFKDAELEESWAGLIDVTPDSMPVIDRVQDIPGLTVATGFSGHGFGTGPAAGQLAADIVMNDSPLVDPAPYRFNRF
ncbi:NAD(P)/FAD-dependent oxidoreductase [Marinomonas communis]|uniref:Glycine/D-amino acid oxidase-like deaminating enzyme n=1 Tax=Marinomonas communis TaxID=28254 RepID=A0A4R6X4R8_9GAMM|nr:FAD-binding oxidoreductase [Marinomonas communis]TDR13965.1 glycine/D-amino acid oxidase-like deaminating enzyme [Marinomonas communis]